MSFSYVAKEVRKGSEPAVADQEKRSMQPLGGDGPHAETANTPDASAFEASTKGDLLPPTLNGLCSQGIEPGTLHAGDSGAPGKSSAA